MPSFFQGMGVHCMNMTSNDNLERNICSETFQRRTLNGLWSVRFVCDYLLSGLLMYLSACIFFYIGKVTDQLKHLEFGCSYLAFLKSLSH